MAFFLCANFQPASLTGLENKKSAVFPPFSHVLSAPIIIHPIKSLKIDQNTMRDFCALSNGVYLNPAGMSADWVIAIFELMYTKLNWLPRQPQAKFEKALFLKTIGSICSISVPNFTLVP